MVGHFSVGASGSVSEPATGRDTPLARACHDLAAATLADADPAAATARLVEAAAGCAREGVTLAVVHRAVFDNVRREFDRLRTTDTRAGADRRLWETLENITVAVSSGYLDEARTLGVPHHSAVDTVTASLLGGIADPAEADECGIELAASYSVLAVALPPSAARADVPPAQPIRAAAVLSAAPDGPREPGGRQMLRRVRAALAERGGPNVLSLLGRDGGTILVPTAVSGRPEVARLVDAVTEATGAPIIATVVTGAARVELPASAECAHELLDMVRRLRMDPGLYRMADLALEYQITRPGPGLDHLGTVLDPLDAQPKLLETLRCHIGNGLNRQRTARMLDLHTNGLDYRLRRIGRLTGHDPGDARGICYLRAALVARSYREQAR
ncbi:PucR family transcriptional regulator [Nocardia higoensis]|uniref:PucR family transcriptional regulator n=1 Tax=Nocardia higoensis TaxID=228599 RepID=UPI000686262D|nr:PucR family transcriptional regulator [Nocardia higoensis]